MPAALVYILSASLGRNLRVKQLDLIHTLADTSSFDELEKTFFCLQSRREAKRLFCHLNVKFMDTCMRQRRDSCNLRQDVLHTYKLGEPKLFSTLQIRGACGELRFEQDPGRSGRALQSIVNNNLLSFTVLPDIEIVSVDWWHIVKFRTWTELKVSKLQFALCSRPGELYLQVVLHDFPIEQN